jgi:hypothetical protein
MNLSKGDKRRLTAPLGLRTSFSVGTVPAGEVIEIQQVDERNRQVLIEDVWVHGPMVERISSPVDEVLSQAQF